WGDRAVRRHMPPPGIAERCPDAIVERAEVGHDVGGNGVDIGGRTRGQVRLDAAGKTEVPPIDERILCPERPRAEVTESLGRECTPSGYRQPLPHAIPGQESGQIITRDKALSVTERP